VLHGPLLRHVMSGRVSCNVIDGSSSLSFFPSFQEHMGDGVIEEPS